jgi:hypothetical protein
MGRIQKRKTNLSKSSLSACNARVDAEPNEALDPHRLNAPNGL